MDIFKLNRYLWFSIVLLVILNLTTLTLLWIGRPSSRSPGQGPLPPAQDQERIRQLLKEQLAFNEEQIQQYLVLREEHHQRAQRLENEIRELKRKMFEQVLEERAPATVSDSLLNLVLAKQAELERMTFQHFLDLKNLCGPGQKEKLRLLMGEVFRPKEPPQMPGRENPPPPQGEEPPPPQPR